MFRQLTPWCLLALLCCGLSASSQSPSAATAPAEFTLRNFKAPDIRFQQLNTSLQLFGSGDYTYINDNNNRGTYLDLRLDYNSFYNTQRRQGSLNVLSDSDINLFRQDLGTLGDRDNAQLGQSLSIQSENRFYFDNGWFVGAHGELFARTINTRQDASIDNQELDQRISWTRAHPYVSVGVGRVEPVTSARTAMDIIRALKNHHRLAVDPSAAQMDSLARVANRVAFRRMFDSRFRRIWQLEELDKALTGMGLISERDMTYFANVSDQWGFAIRGQRGSGQRVEVGALPLYYWQEMNSDQNGVGSYSRHQVTGLLGFVSWTHQTPINYTWQSDFRADFTGGSVRQTRVTYQENFDTDTRQTRPSAVLQGSWALGFYPTTRTQARLVLYGAGNYYSLSEDLENNDFGYNAGGQLEFTYWISPRFRWRSNLGLDYRRQYYSPIPGNAWNDYPQNPLVEDLLTIPSGREFNYNFSSTLTYAIF